MLSAASTPLTAHAAIAISTEERDLFIALDERISLLRKAHAGSSPRRWACRSRRCRPMRWTPAHPRRGVAGGGTHSPGVAQGIVRRGPPPKWQQQIEAISKLPKARQRFVSDMLDTVLAQH